MAYTLLEIVQQILSSMDSDEVNSIGDTTESLQVTKVVEASWNAIVARLDLPEHFSLFQLESLADPTKPTIMLRPSGVDSVLWVRYDRHNGDDTEPTFQRLTYMELDAFLDQTYSLRNDDATVTTISHVIDGETMTFLCTNNAAPQWYTTFDDRTILFDSYDAAIDTTGLVAAKTLAYGRLEQTFSLTDGFVPFLDPDFQVLLLNEAKSLAHLELKQVEHIKAEKVARNEWVHAQHAKRGVDQNRNELDRLPNYGRVGGLYRTTVYTKTQRSGP